MYLDTLSYAYIIFFLAPLANAGHLVSVTMAFTAPEASYGPSRAPKLIMKKSKTTKSDHIVVEGSNRTSFIQKFLSIHDLSDQYSPGVHSGPGFKLWWTGSP